MKISLESKIRYWFYFLRMAHESFNPTIKQNLLDSREFYLSWDDYLRTPFREWWKSHRHLFRTMDAMSILRPGDAVGDDALYLRVPLRYSPTVAGELFGELYKDEYNARLKKKKKIKKIYDGRFELTSEDFQVTQFEYYRFYTEKVFLPLKDSGFSIPSKDFLQRATEVFKILENKKSTKLMKDQKRTVPFVTTKSSDAMRKLNARFMFAAENLMMNASLGMFPGVYQDLSVKTQIEKRKALPKDTVPKSKRGPSQHKFRVGGKKEKDYLFGKRGPRKKAVATASDAQTVTPDSLKAE